MLVKNLLNFPNTDSWQSSNFFYPALMAMSLRYAGTGSEEYSLEDLSKKRGFHEYLPTYFGKRTHFHTH